MRLQFNTRLNTRSVFFTFSKVSSIGALLRRRVLLLALLATAGAACDCDNAIGTALSGVTLLQPEGEPGEFERNLSLAGSRLWSINDFPIVLRNDGRTNATITRVELSSKSSELSLVGASNLPLMGSGEKVEFQLRYQPTTENEVSGTLIIETSASETPKYTIHISGGAASVAVDACTKKEGKEECSSQVGDGNLTIYLGKGRPGKKFKAPLEVINRGSAPLLVSKVGPTFDSSFEFELSPEKSDFKIAPKSSSKFEITYEPYLGGQALGSIEILSDDPRTPRLLVDLEGEGIAPRLCVEPTQLDFGGVTVGSSAEQELNLVSCGLEPFVFGETSLDEGSVFGIKEPIAPGTTLEPGDSIQVTVVFSPKEGKEAFDRLNIFDQDKQVGRVSLRGSGTSCEFTTLPTAPIGFGRVGIGNPAHRNITVINSGTGLCRVREIVPPVEPFELSSAPMAPLDISPGDAIHLEVAFAPTQEVASGSKVVLVADGFAEGYPIALAGIGRPPLPCDIQAQPASLIFTGISVGHSASQKVLVTNVGTKECHVSAGMKTGSQYSKDFSTHDEGTLIGLDIGPGQTKDIEVRFNPTQAITHRGVLELKYSEDPIFSLPGIPIPGFGDVEVLEVPVEARTLEPELCLDPDELNFGDVPAGSTAERQLTLRSCGAGALALRGVILAPGTSQNFELASRPRVPQSLPPGAEIKVTVRYKPRSTSGDFGFIEVLSNDPAKPSAKVRLLGNAGEVCDKQLACAREHLRFPTMEIGRGSSLTVVCQNVGTQPVTISGVSLREGTSAEFRASVGATPQTIPAGGTARLEVSYVPQDAGTDTGAVIIESDACKSVGSTVEGTGKVPNYPACLPPQTFQPVTKWAWEGGNINSRSRNVGMSPVVINLTDDNGDGRIDENDIPDVIFTSCQAGECCINCMNLSGTDFSDQDFSGKGMLRAISGKDGTDLWAVTDPALALTAMTQIAAADLDGDNIPEIVAVKYHFKKGTGSDGMSGKYDSGTLLIFDNKGNVKYESDYWVGSEDAREQTSAPTLTDLDGDGFPEIIFEGTVFNYNGTRRFDLSEGSGNIGHGSHPIAVDLDGDGRPEIFSGRVAYHGDGRVYWKAPSSVGQGTPMVLDVDGDGKPEVVLRDRADRFVILNGQTGQIKAGPFTWPLPKDDEGKDEGVCPAPPAAADLTGDGNPEFIFPSGDYLRVFRLDGKEIWKAPIDDYGGQCGASGAAAFDFEGKGRYDVVYHDTTKMFVFRGSDGTKIYESPRNSSTLWETPVIADVDNDGHADLIMTNENGIMDIGASSNLPGVRALSNTGNSWPATRRIWNQWNYLPTAINENGTVPRVEQPSWESHNSWRANPALCAD